MTAPSDDDESTVRAGPPAGMPSAAPEQPAPPTTEMTATTVDTPSAVVDDEATRLNPPRHDPEEDEATRVKPRKAPAAQAPPRAAAVRKPVPWSVVAVVLAMLALMLVGLWRNQRAGEAKKARVTKDDKRAVDDFFEGK